MVCSHGFRCCLQLHIWKLAISILRTLSWIFIWCRFYRWPSTWCLSLAFWNKLPLIDWSTLGCNWWNFILCIAQRLVFKKEIAVRNIADTDSLSFETFMLTINFKSIRHSIVIVHHTICVQLRFHLNELLNVHERSLFLLICVNLFLNFKSIIVDNVEYPTFDLRPL